MLRLDMNLVWTIINLIIIYLLMQRFLFKPVKNIIAKRQEEAEQVFTEAEAAKKEAQAVKEEFETSMKDVEVKKAEVMAEARKNASTEYQKIVDEASEKAKGIVDDAKVAAENEKKQILLSAQTEIADMVVEGVAKISAANSGSESDRALYDQFLGKADV